VIPAKKNASAGIESSDGLVSHGNEKTSTIERRTQLVDGLKQLLENLSKAPLREEYCAHCGFLMTHVNACVWLDSVHERWEIPLPYCANCNPEVGNHRSFAA
jgi:hypothetical protein